MPAHDVQLPYSYCTSMRLRTAAYAACMSQFNRRGHFYTYSRADDRPSLYRVTTACLIIGRQRAHPVNIVHPPLFDDNLSSEDIPFCLELQDTVADRPLVHFLCDVRLAKTRCSSLCSRRPAMCEHVVNLSLLIARDPRHAKSPSVAQL